MIQRAGDCLILFIEMSSIGKCIEAESRLVVAIVGVREELGMSSNGCRVFFQG